MTPHAGAGGGGPGGGRPADALRRPTTAGSTRSSRPARTDRPWRRTCPTGRCSWRSPRSTRRSTTTSTRSRRPPTGPGSARSWTSRVSRSCPTRSSRTRRSTRSSRPAVVPLGTILRGGKDAFGNERRYRTVDALTAHGAALTGVRSLVPGGTAAGLPGVAACPEFPLTPLAGPDAPHVLRISSPALAFSGGTMGVTVTFEGAEGASGLHGAGWRYSRADGTASTTTASISGSTATLELTGDCGAPTGDPWLEWAVPATHPVPESFGFTAARVAGLVALAVRPAGRASTTTAPSTSPRSSSRSVPSPSAATPSTCAATRRSRRTSRRSRSRWSCSTRAGAVVSSSAGGTGLPQHYAIQMAQGLANLGIALGSHAAAVQEELDTARRLPGADRQTRASGGSAGPVASGSRSGTRRTSSTVCTRSSVGGGSDRSTVSGQQGHYVRAFLAEGDFGWQAYQASIADFATKAAKGGDQPARDAGPARAADRLEPAAQLHDHGRGGHPGRVDERVATLRQVGDRDVPAVPAGGVGGGGDRHGRRRPRAPGLRGRFDGVAVLRGRLGRALRVDRPGRGGLAVVGRRGLAGPAGRRRLAPAAGVRAAPVRRAAGVGGRLHATSTPTPAAGSAW